MIHQDHVGNYGFPTIIAMVGALRIFLSAPLFLAAADQSAGWMIPLIGVLTVMPIYFVYYLTIRLFPGKNIIVIIEEVWGRFLAIPIILFAWLAAMGIAAVTLRQFLETFITVALPRTPISVLLVVAIAVLIYASLLGIEAITRTAFIVGPWILIALVAILIGILPYADLRLLLPFWGPGLSKVLRDGVQRSSMYLEILVAGVFAPCFRRSKDFLTTGLAGLAIGGLINTVGTAIVIMCSGVAAAQAIPYPLYFLARQIYFGRFVQRVEAVFILIWFFAMVVGLSYLFHAAVIIVADGLHLPFYQPLVYPTGIILFIMTLSPRSFVQAQYLDSTVLRQYGSLAYLLIITTYLVGLIRRRGKNSPTAQAQRPKPAGGQ